MTSPAISLSIIIPTYNRIQILWDSIDLLLPQMQFGDELIIIDQNQPALKLPIEYTGKPVSVYRQKTPSLTRARNLGIDLAKGTHLLFVDDDVYPEKDLLENLKDAAARFPEQVIAGGVDQDDSPEVEGVGYINFSTGEIKTNYGSHQEMQIEIFAGCHFMLPQSCLLEKPRFCPHFKGSSQGEEIDYAVRLIKAGKKIQFYPKARLFHRKESDGGCRSEKFQNNFLFDHCFNEGLFFSRNGNLVDIRLFLRRVKNYIEFATRRKSGGHNLSDVIQGLFMTFKGLIKGFLSKPLQ